ncbi:hypothetical protein [Tritonibacter mobilis]|uniref:hypothetical protein n=1 Tax=Tritonibacter mobilis TaxID=379347 RepID=UPI001C08560A|nr:hypothetical protein [Tritonibacter mobilis]MBU3033634.1 hypothetical protein [Tritonibacter mobilis]WHQ84389.1 hypothetical protein OMR53_19755 [Tritonibacter mobilis]
MDWVKHLSDQAEEIEKATDDTKAYGGGWLVVDPQGIVKRVQPPEVVSWAVRQIESR